MKFVDFHTHVDSFIPETLKIVSVHGSVSDLSGLFTMGYHPWWQQKVLKQNDLDLLQGTYHNNLFCLGIGECGLDKLQGAPFDIQMKNFLLHLAIAHENSAPVVIHCVRSFNEIIEARKDFRKDKWCIHGYSKKIDLAKSLLDKGLFLSIAPDESWLHNKFDLLKFLPLDRIFIESDGDLSLSLQRRYEILAQAQNKSLDVVSSILFNNYKIFFGKKWEQVIG